MTAIRYAIFFLASLVLTASVAQTQTVTVPRVTGVSFGSTPAAGQNGTYKLDDVIRVEVVFSEAVAVTGAPQIDLTIGTATRQASYTDGTGTTTLAFAYTVAAGEEDTEGAGINANGLKLNNGTIRKNGGTLDADLAHNALADQAGHKVDGIRPTIDTTYIQPSSPGRPYEPDDKIWISLVFSENVAVTGAPYLELTVGSEARNVEYGGQGPFGPIQQDFFYTVVAGDFDDDGVSVAANGVRRNGGTIRDAAGNDAVLDHDANKAGERHRVSGIAPAVTGVSFGSTPAAGQNGTYKLDDVIRVEVVFSEAVAVTGAPQIDLTIGTATRQASYTDGTGTTTLAFAYTVAAGEEDTEGAGINANGLKLNNGTIRKNGGTLDADLAHNALADQAGHKVDGIRPTIDTTYIQPSSPGRPYEPDDKIWISLVFSENVAVTGAPYLELTVGSEARNVEYGGQGPFGPIQQDFFYTVVAGDFDDDGVSVAANGVRRNGGTIRDAAGNDAVLDHDANKAGERHRVSGIAPAVTGVSFGSTPAAGQNGTYKLDDVIRVEVVFSEAVAVTGAPQIDLTIGTATRQASYTDGTGTTTLAFAYTVAAGEEDTEGAGINANGLKLNNGTIRKNGGTLDADLAHNALADQAGHKVDGIVPVITDVGLSLQYKPDLTHLQGEELVWILVFSEDVEVEGAPYVEFPMGSETRNAAYIKDRTSSVLFSGLLYVQGFSYTFAADDFDEDGLNLEADSVRLNGGTIRDMAGNDAVLDHDGIQTMYWHKVAGTVVADLRSITGFTLFNSGSKQDIEELSEGTVIEALSSDRLNIRADIRTGATVGSVRMELTGAQDSARTENLAPYALFGDKGGQAFPEGEYRIRATPYPERNLGGTPGPTLSVAFTVSAIMGFTLFDSGSKQDIKELSEGAVLEAMSSDRLNIRADVSSGAEIGSMRLKLTGAQDSARTESLAPYALFGDKGGQAFPEGEYRISATPYPERYLGGTPGPTRSVMFTVGLRASTRAEVRDEPEFSRLTIADARAKEGIDATIGFQVTLSPASTHTVTMAYATEDGMARAGEDYTAASGTLTFAPGATEQTILVAVLDDAKDEGEETFTLRLSEAAGATLVDAEALGTIANTDPLPKAWLVRFGRTVAGHVVDAVDKRLRESPGGEHVTIGGRRLPLETGSAAAARPGPAPAGGGEPVWGGRPWDERRAGRYRNMTGRELLLGSSFRLTLGADEDGPADVRWTTWGRVAATRFDGMDGTLSLSGNVVTGTLGVDSEWDRWLAGVAVSHSEGDGLFNSAGVGGELESSLTSVHPYLRYAANERLSMWGLLGYGQGELSLTEDRTEDGIKTRTGMVMGAFGARGVLVSAATGGFDLVMRSDALLARMTSEAVAGMESAEADANRLRLVLEGSRGVKLASGGMLTPSVELGLRHDWGDAETGSGVELGGRVRYADPAWGLTIEAAVRALLAHEASGYEEWGVQGSIRLDPGTSGRGLSLTLVPTWGVASSGVDSLWSRRDTRGLVRQHGAAPVGRFAAELGYGMDVPGGRSVLIPYSSLTLSNEGTHTYRLGARLKLGTSFCLSLEGERRESINAPPEHGLMLRGVLPW